MRRPVPLRPPHSAFRTPQSAIVLILLTASIPLASVPASAGPPASGDWTVTGTETYTGENIVLSGNLTVESGGRLTLDSTKLLFNASFNGQYHLEVKPGGTLVARNGTRLGTVVPVVRFLFWVRPGAAFTMDGSEVNSCGYELNFPFPDRAGLFIQSTGAKITNSRFTGNYIGIVSSPLTLGGGGVTVEGNSFSWNDYGGVLLLLSSSKVSGNTFTGPLLGPFGVLSIDSGAEISGNTLTAAGVFGIGVVSMLAPPASWGTVTGNTVTGSLGAGIYLNRSSPAVTKNSIYLNGRGIWCERCASSIIQNTVGIAADGGVFVNDSAAPVLTANALSNDVGTALAATDSTVTVAGGQMRSLNGIRATRSTVKVTNGSLSDSLSDVRAEYGSVVDMENTTFNRGRLTAADAGSEVRAWWYLHAGVVYYNNTTVPGAAVEARNLTGDVVASGTTGGDGWLRFLLVRGFTLDAYGFREETPHEVAATVGGLRANDSVTLDRTRSVVLRIDNIPPVISILSPLNGALLKATGVTVAGTAADNEFLDRVEVRADSGPWARVEGLANWSLTLNLTEGTHTIFARAADRAGGTAEASVSVRVDLHVPYLNITYPPDGLLTNATSIRVEGETEVDGSLAINGVNVSLYEGHFNTLVPLDTEGQNNITVTAVDSAGNPVTEMRRVWRDTTPPRVNITWPPANHSTNQTSIEFRGEAEANIVLTIGGVQVNTTSNRTAPVPFTLAVPLADGLNLITINGSDAAGNTLALLWRVTSDAVPPEINITYPPENLFTNLTSIRVTGRVTGATNITLNGRPVPPPATGEFDSTMDLAIEGLNTIVLVASDDAGNRAEASRTVYRDTRPPYLSLIRPANGTKVARSTVIVEGTTEVGASVTVNGKEVDVARDGSFAVQVTLSEGDNTIVVVARDRAGNPATMERAVSRTREGLTLGGSTNIGVFIAVLLLVLLLGAVAAWRYGLSHRTTGGPPEGEPPGEIEEAGEVQGGGEKGVRKLKRPPAGDGTGAPGNSPSK